MQKQSFLHHERPPLDRTLHSIKARTARPKTSFFLGAGRLMKSTTSLLLFCIMMRNAAFVATADMCAAFFNTVCATLLPSYFHFIRYYFVLFIYCALFYSYSHFITMAKPELQIFILFSFHYVLKKKLRNLEVLQCRSMHKLYYTGFVSVVT